MFYDLNKIEQIGKILDILENCQGIEQERLYHPEGDVFNHSLQVYKWALRETNDIDLLFAALLHDVGKQIDSHEHEKYGTALLGDLISDKTRWLIDNHMRFWNYIIGRMRKYKKTIRLANHEYFVELAQLGRWDNLGRNPKVKIQYDRIVIINEIKGRTENHGKNK